MLGGGAAPRGAGGGPGQLRAPGVQVRMLGSRRLGRPRGALAGFASGWFAERPASGQRRGTRAHGAVPSGAEVRGCRGVASLVGERVLGSPVGTKARGWTKHLVAQDISWKLPFKMTPDVRLIPFVSFPKKLSSKINLGYSGFSLTRVLAAASQGLCEPLSHVCWTPAALKATAPHLRAGGPCRVSVELPPAGALGRLPGSSVCPVDPCEVRLIGQNWARPVLTPGPQATVQAQELPREACPHRTELFLPGTCPRDR